MDTPISTTDSAHSKEAALTLMKTLVDVARESFLILDAELRVILANPTFYENFMVSPAHTENVFFAELGNGQWDISTLNNLLKEVLSLKTVIRDFEVTHEFQKIGYKTILLNARQIEIGTTPMIVIAMEDITVRKELEQKLAEYTSGLEHTVTKRTREIADRIKELELINRVMVDRELKMIELKREIEVLKDHQPA